MNPRIVGGTEPDPEHTELGLRVLQAALADDWHGCADAIADVCAAGAQAVSTLLYGAADTMVVAHQQRFGAWPQDVDVVVPVWVDARSGQRGGADDVDAGARWAGRFVAARAVGDRVQCEALLVPLRELGPELMTQCVAALVDMCARSIRAASPPCVCGTCPAAPAAGGGHRN